MAKKKKEEKKEEVKVTILPSINTTPVRDEKGHFVKGHPQLGHTPKGSRWKYSNEIINKISTSLLEEMGSDKFQEGLNELFYEDKRSYFQVLMMMAKVACPTNIDVDVNVKAKTLIDDRLAMLVGKKPQVQEY